MPISPFPALQLIHQAIRDRVTPRDEEDRLHSELRGEEKRFVVEIDGEHQEAGLVIENIGLHGEDFIKLGLRLTGYECPTTLKDWEEDIRFLYTREFFMGKGSATELGNPLISNLEIYGSNRRDIRFSMNVYTTYQSGIWDAVERIEAMIHTYHGRVFQHVKRQYGQNEEDTRINKRDLPSREKSNLDSILDDMNGAQFFMFVTRYTDYKSDDDEDESEI